MRRQTLLWTPPNELKDRETLPVLFYSPVTIREMETPSAIGYSRIQYMFSSTLNIRGASASTAAFNSNSVGDTDDTRKC